MGAVPVTVTVINVLTSGFLVPAVGVERGGGTEGKRGRQGEPFEGRPRRRAPSARIEWVSAGGHGGGNDELLNGGSARHRDSHQCPHLRFLSPSRGRRAGRRNRGKARKTRGTLRRAAPAARSERADR